MHRHLWVRKAAARLVGWALATPSVAAGLLGSRPSAAAELAFQFYMQVGAREWGRAVLRRACPGYRDPAELSSWVGCTQLGASMQ